MSDKAEIDPKKLGPLPGESMKDYAARRVVELENAKKTYIDKANFYRGELQKAEADIIACAARLNEMQRIIHAEESEASKKS